MVLHTFGDSHAWFPKSWEAVIIKDLTLKLHKLFSEIDGTAGYTMSRFGYQKKHLLDIKDYGVKENDAILFGFGEIDCRMHICKPKNFEKYKSLINDLVYNYFEAIKENIEQYSNLKVLVYNILPPLRNYGANTGAPSDPEKRKAVVLYMNEKLKEYCNKNNYIFVDVYNSYCDKDKFLLQYDNSLLGDDIHISNGIYVKEFLLKNLMNN